MFYNKTEKIVKKFLQAIGIIFIVLCFVAKKKKGDSVYKKEKKDRNPFVGKKVIFVADEHDMENADGVRGHLESVGESCHKISIYEKYIKRFIDIVVSFGGLLILSPFFAGISLAIIIDDPGPVLFTQKRVGKNKEFFKLHKFRSMKMSTPHDVPTHMLENPEQYITRVGRFLRAHSLDELPQIWDIFIGNMSVIGPRPALWNQDVLVAERDKYGANDVKPGLTGWAQINGRDELEIPVKAKLDGEYVKKESFLFDIKCFFKTVGKIVNDDSVVEGGTGEMKKKRRNYTEGKSDKELIGHIGFGEPVQIDKKIYKKILITGEGSYVGESFKEYAEEHYKENFAIDTIDMIGDSWREKNFSGYDIVYHVAGIAHADVGNVSEEIKEKYYQVNTDLAIEVAKKAKDEGVKEFIFMSSMIIYGDSAPYGKKKIIDEKTVPVPANFYGDSKLQADVAIRDLANDTFKVIVLRPPMIYGEGCKGNYQTLVKLAKWLPIFPNVDNERSVLYIGNLCELLCQVMLINLKQNASILMPQNIEWEKTSKMVSQLANKEKHKLKTTKILNPYIYLGSKFRGKIGKIINKAFGNFCYSHKVSKYEGINYFINQDKETMLMKKKVLFLVNHDIVIYNFRLELVERLLAEGYEVHISSPYGEKIKSLKKLGAIYHEVEIDRHGMNLISETKLLLSYRKLLKIVKPDIILGYTIKPNIYGAIAARYNNIPFVANITGLGLAVESGKLKKKFFVSLYRIAFKKVQKVFFQNEENRDFFIVNKIALNRQELLPGSGVNLERFTVFKYPEDEKIKFAFISRIMKEKGADYYLEAAKTIKREYPNTEFHVCGFCEKEYEGKLKEYSEEGIIIYHGMINNVADFLKNVHCVIHPTYYPEGISNVLLEASASGRPIITTDRSGCKEVIQDGINGYMIPQKDGDALVNAIKKFLMLDNEKRKKMGLEGRKKVEREFDRQIVVNAYMKEIENTLV